LRAGLADAAITVRGAALPPARRQKCWQELTRTVDCLMNQKVERNDIVTPLAAR